MFQRCSKKCNVSEFSRINLLHSVFQKTLTLFHLEKNVQVCLCRMDEYFCSAFHHQWDHWDLTWGKSTKTDVDYSKLTIHWCLSPALEPDTVSDPSVISSTELRDRRAGEDGTQPWTGKEADEERLMKETERKQWVYQGNQIRLNQMRTASENEWGKVTSLSNNSLSCVSLSLIQLRLRSQLLRVLVDQLLQSLVLREPR